MGTSRSQPGYYQETGLSPEETRATKYGMHGQQHLADILYVTLVR